MPTPRLGFRRGLGLFMIILGVGEVVILAGILFRIDALVVPGQTAFFLMPIWTLWLGEGANVGNGNGLLTACRTSGAAAEIGTHKRPRA